MKDMYSEEETVNTLGVAVLVFFFFPYFGMAVKAIVQLYETVI